MSEDTKRPCPARIEAIEALASGVETAPGIREHLLECPGCNAFYRRQRRFEDLVAGVTGALDDASLRIRPRPRRLSPARIAVASLALAAVAAAVTAGLVLGNGKASSEDRVTPAPVAGIETPAPVEVPEAPAQPGKERLALTTSEGEHLVHGFDEGVRLSLSDDGEAYVERTGERVYVVDLHEGLLVADVTETEPRTRLSVEAKNLRVEVRGTLFSVRAEDHIITEVEVEHGEVEIMSKIDTSRQVLHPGEALVLETFGARPRDESAPSLHAAFDVEEIAPEEHPATPKAPVKEKQEASGYEIAVALRAEGMYAEAVEAFLDAARTAKGLERERCLFQAASLSLAKLDDPQKAILLGQSYLGQYPAGFYAEDTHLLKARAYIQAKEYEKARAVLVGYISDYPQGSQVALAHLLLGKIFATTYGNCKAARPHLQAVIEGQPSGPITQQAQSILSFCKKSLK